MGEVEPTFEQAQSWWKRMQKPVTFPGVAGHPYQPAVLWNAGLLFSPLLYTRPLSPDGLKLSGPQGLMRELAGYETDALQIEFSFGAGFHFPDRLGKATREGDELRDSHGRQAPSALSLPRNDSVEQELLGGNMPIVVSRVERDGIVWTCTVFSRLARGFEARSGKEDLLAEARWTAENPWGAAVKARMACHLTAPHVTLGYKVDLLETVIPYARALWWDGTVLQDDRGMARLAATAGAGGEIAFHRRLPDELVAGAEWLKEKRLAQDVMVLSAEAPAGGSVSFRLLIPYFAMDTGMLRKALEMSFDEALTRCRKYWQKQFKSASIETPETIINDSFDAYLYQGMLAAGRKPRSGHWILKTSPNNYEGLWGAHASIGAFSLDLRGQHALSRKVLDTFLANQGPIPEMIFTLSGVGGQQMESEGFSDHPGFLGSIDGFMAFLWAFYNGWTMWAIGQHARLTNDWDWFRGHADKLALACEWIAEQRKRTKLTDAAGRKALSYGLLPASNAFDWGFGHMFWSDAHSYRGIKEIAGCFERIGHARAVEFQREAEEYRQDIITSVSRCRDASPRVPLDDGRSLPFVPMSVEMRDYFKPDWTYAACGPLNLAWAGVVPADHELIGQVLAVLEAGRPLGEWDEKEQKYQGWDWGVRTPADEDFLECTRPKQGRCYWWRHKMTYEPGWIPQAFAFMERDDLPALFEHFYSCISNGGQHVEIRSPIEQRDGVPWCQPGQANLLWLIRNMLVREEGRKLVLAGSCPLMWLAPGKKIAVRGLPTYFGAVTYRIESQGAKVKVTFAPEFREAPESVAVRLRRPDGALPKSVMVNGRREAAATGFGTEVPKHQSEWVRLPAEGCVVEVGY